MTETSLKAALYLEAVLPALEHLAPHDEPLRHAAAAPRAFAISLAVRGGSRRRLAFSADGTVSTVVAAVGFTSLLNGETAMECGSVLRSLCFKC